MSDVAWVFSNPILTLHCDQALQLNPQLTELILQLEKKEGGLNQSNRGGWQSEKTLQSINSGAIGRLMSLIDAAVCQMASEITEQPAGTYVERNWDVVAWANVNRKGDFNIFHYHVGGFWSGVYYVSLPPDMSEEDGAIIFRNPTSAPMLASVIRSPQRVRAVFKPNMRINPVPGMLLIFPSWLEHSVLPHSVRGERISVGFDVIYRNWTA